MDLMKRRLAPPPMMTSLGWPAMYGESDVLTPTPKLMPMSKFRDAVSYTHLTLPTICSV